MSSALQEILAKYRANSLSEREKGTYFEELIRTYFRFEASYADLYSEVWLYADWAKAIGTPQFGLSAKDTGIDLVAKTHGTAEYHAIQCKCFAPDYRVRKADIDSFFTASGQKPFTQRIIVTTTDDWSENAQNALSNQQPPVYKVDLHDLENSQIDWAKFQPSTAPVLKPKYPLRPHQLRAHDAVLGGFKSADRGKLIMACGTGKTFTSLKIAEGVAGKNKLVLFLVPSLNLLSQTLTEWTQQSMIPLHSFAVCSDTEVGKKRDKDEDIVETFAHELRYPATTDARRLAEEVKKRHDAQHMSVIFSTYHSLDVISDAQKTYGLPEIQLVICDEAHRTTGATFESDKESNKESHFVKIHDNQYIHAAKRLYMTATPRLYADAAKATAEKDNVTLCSMDDEALYGKQLHVITFSEAVQQKLLTDYKVLVLAIDAKHVDARIQALLEDDNNQLHLDDAARIVGCWKALGKQGVSGDFSTDPEPMRRAVAFCQVIERSSVRGRKVSSKHIAEMFSKVVTAYQEEEGTDSTLLCEAAHVDGSMNAGQKEEKLNWLKANSPDNTCRILCNVRCLSEGVDVPALDAVLFLTPRNSQVDVVQSVGRVMRNAPGKQLGYVILPVVIPVGMEPHEALNDNKTYKVVWQVLQALRSHDDTFDAMINKLDLIGSDPRKMEVIAITDKVQKKAGKSQRTDTAKTGRGGSSIGTAAAPKSDTAQTTLQFHVGEIERALYAKIVKKCGNPNHWEDWANDIANIANTHIVRITNIVNNPKNTKEVESFRNFADELRDDLNDSISDAEVIEMLAQHLITKPVFDALFEDYSFASHNPVSKAMQQVLEVLQEHRLDKETDTLEKFYASVKQRASKINDIKAKQKIVVELYDKFFRNAFPKMTERLGIVYTPVEVVDFIIHSINDLLQQEFGQTLGSKGVHIIDPFTGTGTFITRLLQSGLIKPEELPHKYKHEIHANEIVLLAYYIAAINIEAVYHSLVGGKYEPFEGICLTDTFRLGEEDLISGLLANNSDRRKRLQKLEVRVIMGNPPYSKGQESANDNNQNVAYPQLDERIRDTYAARSVATNNNSIYDSYIRAIRWASDRIKKCGVIGFVTNAGWIDGRSADGLRKCLAEEFSTIHVLHLRGNARTAGEQRRKEKDNVFGQGSRAPIAISLLVKNPNAATHGQIFFHDIGDYLTAEQKLQRVSSFQSAQGIAATDGWARIKPDICGDWLKQRDVGFEKFITLGDKKTDQIATFDLYSRGIATGRDAWCYNSSMCLLENNIQQTTEFFDSELSRFNQAHGLTDRKAREEASEALNSDPGRISWTRALRSDIAKNRELLFRSDATIRSLYRPFFKQWLYFDRRLNEMVYQIPRLFPATDLQNKAIMVKQRWAGEGNLALMIDHVVDLQSDGGAQCFPLYLYEKATDDEKDSLFGKTAPKDADSYTRRDGISDAGLAHFQKAYPAKDEGETTTKEDLFYYIYGLLHSADYRSRYADNLAKELPRIPAVKTFADFMAFSKAGRELAHWHLKYETVACYPGVTLDCGKVNPSALPDSAFHVTKMKFAKTKDATGKSVSDKTSVIYNERITIKNIPLEAYDYVVNGKPALEWVMERQAVTTDKDSGIVNDANLWATETMGNAKYPLELFLRVITVSLETMKIVNALPPLGDAGELR